MVKWLCVAEKPSIAKAITQILSGGQFETRDARAPKWIKNYSFSYRMGAGGGHTDFTVTAVAGHLTSNDFEDQYRKWHSCDPVQLFEARVKTYVTQDPEHRGIEANLLAEARKATHLMIWTDCDREGEFIGSMVAQVCRKAKPNIVVKRARFSAIIPAQINQAARNPVDLDQLQAEAVQARMELDLRVGSIFTRTQTLELQNRVATLAESMVSYGPCQFPTLGFVVDQYERVNAFVPEPFWYIHVGLNREGTTTSFSWRRGRLYDQPVAEAVFTMVKMDPEATVTKWETKPTQKWKPLPLTTVELQKSGSRLLRMSPKRVLEIAETLYQRGILSYPRTETDQFDRDFNFHELIQKQTADNAWGAYADGLLNNGGFERPRNGKKNDKAHPPIHPTAHVNNLAGEEKKVYELIVRRFLGCCSKNARGLETTCEIDIAGEVFSAKGLVIRERNYLDVYVYDKWNGNHLPEFQVYERFQPDELELKEGRTTQPSLLTEADLVSLMDKNGIGTDATIAEHIAKIIDREYVFKQREGTTEYLVPSTLGIGLVKAYDSVGLENSLTKPHLRRLTEERLVQICDGTRNKNDVINQTLDEYREVFHRTRHQMQAFVAVVRQYVEGQVGQNGGNGRGGGGGGGAAGRRGGHNDDSDDDDLDGDGAPPRGAANGGGARGTAGRGRGGRAAGPARAAAVEDVDAGGDPPACNCQEPAVERTVVKEGANKGRHFYGCAKPREESCGFFAWADEQGNGGGGPRAQTNGRGAPTVPQKRRAPTAPRHNFEDRDQNDEASCECGLKPALLTVSKEGPNQGRSFYKCSKISKSSQCGYFAWADEIDSGDRNVRQRSMSRKVTASRNNGGPAPTGECFNCGETGGATGECFKCGEAGHWSKDCPQGGSKGGGGGGGESNYSCFKSLS
ncbi:DNA topoisomerase III [Rhodotorula taiwanensis]|uniref:DNA topoisomerase n=1 Tax=Rhodotorula taiwanensis TaxID=741276 RepID=A0A2S5BEA1_9BASI|nr:DNA topoisomerase III [Rhodotorula taiwanensis]